MNRQVVIRIIVLVLLVAGISSLHYLTTTHKDHYHDIYRRLYYIPIVLGGLWFSLRGGLGTSFLVSLVYMPHVLLQWGHHPGSNLEQYLEILLYNVIGFLTGLLSQRELEQKRRYQQTAQSLEESYGRLRSQADQILEIEEQLRRADRLSALGELSAGMAHEIRNPLGSIKGTAEIIRDGIDPNNERYEFAQILVREVDRLEGVVRDFLSFARPQDGARQPVSVCAALSEVVALARQQAVQHNVEINFSSRPEQPKVAGDFEQFKQAFLNLVLNAIQVMPDGGTLDIGCGESDGQVRVTFIDSGPGIPEDLLDRIFNPFFTTRSEGTGLGLAITHRIIDGHGGRLRVANEPGRGARFTVELPIDKSEEGR